MVGEIDFNKKNVIVIGAGLSGLLASYYLHRAGFTVKLIEKKKRAGGLIETKETPFGICEKAAHSFLATPLIEKLAQDLGLNLVKAQAKTRYILRDGKLRRFPLKINEALPGLFRLIFSKAKEKPKNFSEWAKFHANEKILEYLISPFLIGIFGAKATEISPWALYPQIATLPGEKVLDALKRAKKHKEKRYMASFETSMGSFVAALASYLKKELKKNFILGEEVKDLPKNPKDTNLVITIPAYEAAKLFEKKDKKLALGLKEVSYNPFVSVTVFLDKKADIPKGVGVLIPPIEKRKILGVLFNSHTFPNRAKEGFHSLTVFLGGSFFPQVIEKKDQEISELIQDELDFLFSAAKYIRHLEISRWEKGIPLYNEAILKVREAALSSFCSQKGNVLFGNYTGNISFKGLVFEAYSLANP